MIKTNVLAINTITGKYLRASDGKIPVKYFLHCSEGFLLNLLKVDLSEGCQESLFSSVLLVRL